MSITKLILLENAIPQMNRHVQRKPEIVKTLYTNQRLMQTFLLSAVKQQSELAMRQNEKIKTSTEVVQCRSVLTLMFDPGLYPEARSPPLQVC